MRELIQWLLGFAYKERQTSSEIAKQRVRLVLIQDRVELAPEVMQQMKEEILEVVSRYMVVEDDFIEFEVRRLEELMMLVSNIEIKDASTLMAAPAR